MEVGIFYFLCLVLSLNKIYPTYLFPVLLESLDQEPDKLSVLVCLVRACLDYLRSVFLME